MIAFLFMIVWWGALALLTFWVLFTVVFLVFLAQELLGGQSRRRARVRPVPPRPAQTVADCLCDWADPLEEMFALPSAPEPKARR